jgi:hypothetical protein
MQNRQKGIRRLTTCAMLCALSVVVLYLGAVMEVVDISVAVIASLLAVIVVIEYGGVWPWVVYGVTSLLALLLLPNKTPALMYVLFFGFYPIVKEKIESMRQRVTQWVVKEAVFNVALAVMIWLSLLFFTEDAMMWELVVIFAVLANVAFVLYDVAMTRLISLYIYKLRSRFRIKK